jgi:hypothetical protein
MCAEEVMSWGAYIICESMSSAYLYVGTATLTCLFLLLEKHLADKVSLVAQE